jgi:hypothetical protein
MRKIETIVADIHAIRQEIDRATDGMSPSQVSEYFHSQTEPIIRRFGFKVYKGAEKRE